MRVNVYAEEITDRVEITEKDGFTGLRFYLELPASVIEGQSQLGGKYQRPATPNDTVQAKQIQAPFIHRPGDDDSSAVTFWGKRDLRTVLRKALDKLDEYYAVREASDSDQSSRGGDICSGAKAGLRELHPGIDI